MSKLIIPKTNVQGLEAPLIFLAGPIGSAPNWQDEAIGFLFSQKPDLVIASPRKGTRANIAPYIITGNEFYFSRQRAWERYYIDIASKTGAVLFWLPGEAEHNCKKVYGAMTRFEAGLVLGWYKYDKGVSFCVGTDGRFSEFDTMLYDFTTDAPDKKINNSLEETCREAVRLAYRK